MRVPVLAATALVLALSACQDPSGVGLGLIDDEESNPNVRTLAATGADTAAVPLVTSGFANSTGTDQQARVLAGRVLDPLYGDAVATAYVDAVAPTTLPDGFASRPVTRVTLELRRDYVYGDTTAALPVELRQVVGSWAPTRLPADTTLGTGDLLTTTTMTASDTTVVFTLPQAWVSANAALFASATFSSAFEGFELRVPTAPGRGAVVGFNVSSAASVVRVATAQDTTSFRLAEVYTRVEQAPPPVSPPGRLLLRASAPVGLQLAFDYASVLRLPVAQAVFRVPLDRSLSGAQGTFVRPLASGAALYARPETGDPVALVLLNTAGTTDARTQPSPVLTGLVQDLLLEQAAFNRLEVQLARNPLSLDVFPVVLDATPGPRLSLTVVGQAT